MALGRGHVPRKGARRLVEQGDGPGLELLGGQLPIGVQAAVPAGLCPRPGRDLPPPIGRETGQVHRLRRPGQLCTGIVQVEGADFHRPPGRGAGGHVGYSQPPLQQKPQPFRRGVDGIGRGLGAVGLPQGVAYDLGHQRVLAIFEVGGEVHGLNIAVPLVAFERPGHDRAAVDIQPVPVAGRELHAGGLRPGLQVDLQSKERHAAGVPGASPPTSRPYPLRLRDGASHFFEHDCRLLFP